MTDKTWNRITWVFIFLLFFYGFFMAGRCYEARKWVESKELEKSEYRKERMTDHHGTQAAWEENGIWYFTRNPKDHENRKKWVKL